MNISQSYIPRLPRISSFTLLEAVAVQAIKEVHDGTNLCQMAKIWPEVLALVQERYI